MLMSVFLSCVFITSVVDCLEPTSVTTDLLTPKKSTVSSAVVPKIIKLERLIPAVVTIGLFLIGVLVISIDYWIQKRASTKSDTDVLKQEPLNSEWLKALKQSQSTASKIRRASAYPTSFLSRDRKTKLKKYALYDEMLAKYKRSLKIQKLSSLKKTALNVTEEGSIDNDSGNTLSPLKRVNSKTRMRDLALRHRMSQEHHSMMDLPSRERYLPRWGTASTSSTYDGSEGNARLTVSFGDDNAFREVLDRSVELSQEFSMQLSTDDDTEPLLDKKSAKQGVFQKNDSILEDPDIKDALRKLSSNDEAQLPASNRQRPKSMFAGRLNDTSFTDKEAEEIVKMKRRISWYQVIPDLAGDGKKKTGTISIETIDEMIEQHVAMALVSRLPEDMLEFHQVGQGKGDRRKSGIGKIRGSRMFEEVCIYDEENDGDAQQKKSMRPKSLNIFEKLKKRVGRGNSVDHAIDHGKEEAITDLFAQLMDLPSPRRDSKEFLLSHFCGSTEEGEVSQTNEKAVDDMLSVVEKRMIEHLHERDDLDFNEVSALENLLDSVSQFCVQYSEDFEDVESRRQMSFSRANEELIEAEARSSSGCSSRQSRNGSRQPSFDDRRDKVMSMYDTDLLDAEPVKIPDLTNL